MLLLHRRTGEIILVNQGEIKIKVVTINPDCVLIGVHAPKHIAIDRQEFLAQKSRDRQKYCAIKDVLL